VIAILLTGSLAWAQGVGYQLRGDRKFENEIDGHNCKELFIKNRNASQLSLPDLDEFSHPSFCGRFVAYWGVSGDSNYSLVVADLKTRVIVKKLPVGRLELETDYMYHLTPAVWDTGCTIATSSDQRYIRKTVIRAKSN
jgi:hypothetical protein